MNEKLKGTLLVLAAAVIFSFAGLFVKLITWDNMAIVAGRSFATGAAALLCMKIRGRKPVLNKPVIFCGFSLSALSISFVMATKLTSAANAIVLQYTQPVFIILALWLLFGQKPKKEEITVIIVAFAGILCFFMDRLTPGGFAGNVIAVFSGLLFALVFLAKKMDGADYESSIFVSAVINLCAGFWQIPSQSDFRPVVLLMLVLYGTLPCAVGYMFLSAGLDRVSLVTGAVICMLEPILNPIWVALFYGETIGRMAFFGTVILLCTATAYSIMQIKQNDEAVKER